MKCKIVAPLLIAGAIAAPQARATNGMDIEGYGPVAAGMGGASMAYDNGTAAAINNPATLGFMAPGSSRLDIAVGDLMPDARANGQSSTAKDFYTPAAGYARKDGRLSWGIGISPQGGMGTDYASGGFWGALAPFNPTANAGLNALTGQAQALRNMSQVELWRVIFPLAYAVTPDLTLGGSVDYVRAGIDIKWLIDGAHFRDMVGALGGNQTFAQGSGSLISTMLGVPGFAGLGYGYFDFEKGGQFSQAATGDGYAGNLGFTYRLAPTLTVGGVYHGKTHLSDLSTGDSSASLTFAGLVLPAPGAFVQAVTGKATVKNFQWPETYAVGLSWQAHPDWTVNADYKRINWAEVMKNFTLGFQADGSAANGSFAGKTLDVTYFQNWKDQDVLAAGAAWRYDDALTLRFGGNFATNPIPDDTVSPLFPAIMKTHYTAGLGYAFAKGNSLDLSFVYAPKVTVTNNWSAAGGSNQTISLGGMSWQAMYSHGFQ